MPRIVYTQPDQTQQEVEVESGTSVMRAAVVNGIDGIVGECGGQAMCATCHVFVEAVEGTLPEIGEDEDEMLDCTVDERRENSRLSCQLKAADKFSEIAVQLPDRQV